MTIRVDAHSLQSEETDLSHLDVDGAERLYPSPSLDGENADARNPAKMMAGREGFEPSGSKRVRGRTQS
jgi:hypothetical protein